MENINISPTLKNIIVESIHSNKSQIKLALSSITERDKDIIKVISEDITRIGLTYNSVYSAVTQQVYIIFDLKPTEYITKLIEEEILENGNN